MLILVLAIYLNFFNHHYIWDMRWLLFGVIFLLFNKTQVFYRITHTYRQMPLLLGWLLVALFIWFAENIATYLQVWIYPNQTHAWQMVSLSKLSSWYLLMLLSFH